MTPAHGPAGSRQALLHPAQAGPSQMQAAPFRYSLQDPLLYFLQETQLSLDESVALPQPVAKRRAFAIFGSQRSGNQGQEISLGFSVFMRQDQSRMLAKGVAI